MNGITGFSSGTRTTRASHIASPLSPLKSRSECGAAATSYYLGTSNTIHISINLNCVRTVHLLTSTFKSASYQLSLLLWSTLTKWHPMGTRRMGVRWTSINIMTRPRTRRTIRHPKSGGESVTAVSVQSIVMK